MARKKQDQNPDIGMARLAPLVQVREDAKRPAEREPRDLVEYIGVAAKVARSTIYCGNWKIPNAEKHFPYDPLLRTVDRYFPYAEGGKLYVDRPTTDGDEAECLRKRAVLKKEGARYLYITDGMTLSEALDQMEAE